VNITEEQLQSFIELYKRETGIKLSPADAQFQAESILFFLLCCCEKEVEQKPSSDILPEPGLSIENPNIVVLRNGQ